jgi:serine/threonine protein kinase
VDPESDDMTTSSQRDADYTGTEFQPGAAVGGRYQVISRLGKGGMGLVYRVNQIFLNKEFALKTIDKNCISDINIRRFQQEARTAFSLDHPNIIAVNDFGLLEDQTPFLVMELLTGETVGERLKRTGCLTLEEAIPIFVQACFGLAYAHERGVVHRDIKPNNIMLLDKDGAGTEGSVKILDFGIAKLTEHEGGEMQALTRTGEIFGSPLYMSPEQCNGARVDHRSDIYSLGCVFFEVLTGAPPIAGENALITMMKHQTEQALTLKQASLGTDFPQAIEDIVAAMLAKSPENRYQNLGIVAHDLGALKRGEAISQTAGKSGKDSLPKTERTVSMSTTRFYALMLGVALSTATIAGALGYLFHNFQEQKSLPAKPKKNEVNTQVPEPAGLSPAVVKAEEDQLFQRREAAAASFSEAKPIKSEIVLIDGVRRKQISFPEFSIGRLSNLNNDTEPGHKEYFSLDAERMVVLPPNATDEPLTLEMGGNYLNAVNTPSIVQKIDPGLFFGLSITGNKPGDEFLKTSPEDASNVVRILQTAAGWSKLESIFLYRVPLNQAAFDALNKMKKLRMFSEFSMPTAGVSFVSRQPFLKKIQYLKLGDAAVDPVLLALAGSSDLRSLTLQRDLFSPKALLELRRCPQLEELHLENDTISDSVIAAVTQVKSLKKLIVRGARLTPTQTKLLSKYPIKFYSLPRSSLKIGGGA